MDYFERLRRVGFRVEAFDIANELDLAQIKRYGLALGELIPLAFKDWALMDRHVSSK